MNKTFFISDTHFNHDNVIEYENRPFKNVEEMNNYMIQKWNNVVDNNDVVYHLGDFGFKSFEKSQKILSQLNGGVVLIKGNHDRMSNLKLLRMGFKEVKSTEFLPFFHQGWIHLLLTHRPAQRERVGIHTLNLHGHIHTKKPEKYNCYKYINLSVEMWDYTPQTIEQILEREVKEWRQLYSNSQNMNSEL